MLLQETKCSKEVLGTILSKFWKIGCSMAIESTGTVGGLALLWNLDKFLFWNFFCTKYSISTNFQPLGEETSGFITNFYRPQQLGEKLIF